MFYVQKADNVFAECRVRFLSFMGIAMNNVRLVKFNRIVYVVMATMIAHFQLRYLSLLSVMKIPMAESLTQLTIVIVDILFDFVL